VTRFDTILIVDWSAGRKSPPRPSKDAIWLGLARAGQTEDPIYCRTRAEAEAEIAARITQEQAARRRILIGFDFPFGYPKGFARAVTGSDDPFVLWDWLAARIEDAPDGQNNRYDVAEAINQLFPGPGPFWGKPHKTNWPNIPYRKEGIIYDLVAEKRQCERVSKAASSCFQLAFPPTVGGQVLMGLPVLSRLRRLDGVAVWPFEPWAAADTVLVEIWPGLIEPAVKAAMAKDDGQIRDAVQVTRLALTLSRLPEDALLQMLSGVPPVAREEAWILGADASDRFIALAGDDIAPPPLRNDCFALPAGVDWTPVDTALQHLKDHLGPISVIEDGPVSAASGRVLAAPVVAKRSNPPQSNTAVDGYGFHGGVPEGDHHLPLVSGRAAAGQPFDGTVPEGHAIRVLTGAMLPEGVDTVILDEDVTRGRDDIAFLGPLKPGANTRNAGEDISQGQEILGRGRRLTPADLALASAVGVARLPLRRPLKVAVISTGDELVEPGDAAGPGQIYDANRPMLTAMIQCFGHQPLDLGRAPDDRAALRTRFDQAAVEADVVITSGGASAGDEDHVSALLSEAGTLDLWRIAVKPGRPLALGLWSGKPVFGLPGNPVAAMVCTLIFARPALAILAGEIWPEPQGFLLPAAFEKRKKPGRREYLRARMRAGQAEVFPSEGSGRISGLSWAEGLVEIEDGARHIQPGDPVRYIPFGSFGL